MQIVSASKRLYSSAPKVSVIVTCLNSASTVAECVESVTSQDYPNVQVILVDGGSTDDTKSEALRAASNAQNFRMIVDESASTPARGRNKGAEIADGEFLAFTDADCIAERSWVSNLVDPKNWKTQVGAVGGKTVFTEVPSNKPLLSALHAALGTRLGNGGSAEFLDRSKLATAKSLPACNVMYPSKIFNSHGGFDESLRYCEDSCLSARIRDSGLRLMYDPGAVIYHRHRDSVRHFLRWMFDYGNGRGVAIKRDRRALTGATVFLLLGPLGILGVAIWKVIPVEVLLTIVLGSYFGLDLAYAISRTRSSLRETLLYFASYSAIHLSYVAGLLRGLARWRTGSTVRSSSRPFP